MTALPLIVGFGGYNAAGRSSCHHGFKRMVFESLPSASKVRILTGLGVMTKLLRVGADGRYSLADGTPISMDKFPAALENEILSATLVRRIEPSVFDVDAAPWQQSLSIDEEGVSFTLSRRQLPEPLPEGWVVTEKEGQKVHVTLPAGAEVRADSLRDFPVKSAGQLPTGFDPGEFYNSHFHPRALQMTVTGVSDALYSTGIPWQDILDRVGPDQVAVYSGNILGQADQFGIAGMMQSRLRGHRVQAKQLPLGLNTMSADFINAYVLGSVGSTGSMTGACATFLYNLKLAISDIQSGRTRVAIVGNAEAPLSQEVIDGFAAMSALGSYDGLKKIEGTETPDLRRSSRPFGENCGFTIAESAQFVVLMDDALAMDMGAQIHGAATDVFVNADGYKRSISAPGAGNFITMAKAVSAAKALLGDAPVQKHSFVHAHGSSTPANRVTESSLLSRVAEAFGIEHWPIAAVKAYVGHSLGPASGDQVVAALGSFASGLVPGIKTIDAVAADVIQSRLGISLTDSEYSALECCFINSKGFGGNNATGVLLSPLAVRRLLEKRYGKQAMVDYEQRAEASAEAMAAYEERAMHGQLDVVYRFGEDMIDDEAIQFHAESMQIPGYENPIQFPIVDSRYEDLT